MSMHMGADSDPTIANLSLNDHRCNSDDCIAFYAAHNRSQATVSYYYQYEYGHWTTWYYIIVIFLFMVVYAYHLWYDRRIKPFNSSKSSILDKAVAVWRTIAYRRYRGRVADILGLPSIGLQIFLLGPLIFATIATFAARPYYRERRGFGSPPLAIRTGLMSIALTPIIFALAGKVNLVTLLTGIGYEKLNVIHRWTSYLCFALAVVHTVPFIVAPLKEGGPHALHKQYYKNGGFEYTGTPPLAFLFFLVTFSIPYIRHRVYELFVYSHWLVAIAYLGLMFWHAGNEGDSWTYLWASLAILLFSILTRIFYKSSIFSIRRSWLDGFPSTIQELPGEMTKLQVFVPSTYCTWRPGQHCFLRIPTLSLMDNHPFTIASAPNSSSSSSDGRVKIFEEKGVDVNTLTFLIRPHSGFTRRLSSYASDANDPDVTLRTFIDGPYGGISRKIENVYNSIILVAGGGGITASIAWLLYLTKCMGEEEKRPVAVKQLKLVWVVRKKEHLSWVKEELEVAVKMAPTGAVSFEFHITNHDKIFTGDERSPSPISSQQKYGSSGGEEVPKTVIVDDEKKGKRQADDAILSTTISTATTDTMSSPSSSSTSPTAVETEKKHSFPTALPNTNIHNHKGQRPSLQDIITQSIIHERVPPTTKSRMRSRACILGCGPESMKIDLSNAVARVQKRVWLSDGEVKEVVLETESFGW